MVSTLVGIALLGSLSGSWAWHTVRYTFDCPVFLSRQRLMLGMGLLSAWGGSVLPLGIPILCMIGMVVTVTMLSLIDEVFYRLPDHLTQPLLWAGLLAPWAWPHLRLEEAVYGALAGYCLLWGINWLWSCVTHGPGIGRGDMKLAGALGAWLGIDAIPSLISWSTWMATVVVLMTYLRSRQLDHTIAFGPYLGMSGMALMLCLSRTG